MINTYANDLYEVVRGTPALIISSTLKSATVAKQSYQTAFGSSYSGGCSGVGESHSVTNLPIESIEVREKFTSSSSWQTYALVEGWIRNTEANANLALKKEKNMKTNRFIGWGLVCAVAFLTSILFAQAGNAAYLTGGNVGSGRSRSLTNVSLSSVEIKEQFFVADGWQTSVSKSKSRAFWNTQAPRLRGRHSSALYRALQQLSSKGYTTVDITVWEGVRSFGGRGDGGWKVVGRDNPAARRREADKRQRERQRQQEARDRRERRREERSSGNSRPKSYTRSCQVYLHAGIHDNFPKTSASINVADEYINVSWGNTNVNKGEPYYFKVIIEDRSGKQRELRPGRNWVNPGRYKMYLTYSYIRSTSVTIKYKCK